MQKLLRIVFAVLSLSMWNIQFAYSQEQNFADGSALSREKQKLLKTIKILADQKQPMEINPVKQILAADLVASSGLCRVSGADNPLAGQGAYKAQSKNFWFKNMPGQKTQERVFASFHDHVGHAVKITPIVLYCTAVSSIGNKPVYTVWFQDIAGYSCIKKNEIDRYFHGTKLGQPRFKGDPLTTSYYIGQITEEWGNIATFRFYNGCLNNVEITQHEENGNHYKKVIADLLQCQYSTEEKYCAEHGPANRYTLTHYVDDTCGTEKKFYTKVPFDAHIPVPAYPHTWYNFPPSCIKNDNASKE